MTDAHVPQALRLLVKRGSWYLQDRPGGILCRTVRARFDKRGRPVLTGAVTVWFCRGRLSLRKSDKAFYPTFDLRDRSAEQLADSIAAFARTALDSRP